MQQLSSRLLPRNRDFTSPRCNILAPPPSNVLFRQLKRTGSHSIFRFINSSLRSERHRFLDKRRRKKKEVVERTRLAPDRYTFLIKIFLLLSVLFPFVSRADSQGNGRRRNQHRDRYKDLLFFPLLPPSLPQVLPEFWRRQSSFHENLLRRLTLT